MDRPRIYVDLNEMVTEEIVLLSKEDTKMDSEGNMVAFYDRMRQNLEKLRRETDPATEDILLELMDCFFARAVQGLPGV